MEDRGSLLRMTTAEFRDYLNRRFADPSEDAISSQSFGVPVRRAEQAQRAELCDLDRAQLDRIEAMLTQLTQQPTKRG